MILECIRCEIPTNFIINPWQWEKNKFNAISATCETCGSMEVFTFGEGKIITFTEGKTLLNRYG